MIIARSTDRKSKLNRPTSDNFILIPPSLRLLHSCRSCTDNVACRTRESREIDNDALKIDFLSFRTCGRKIFRHQAVCQSMGLSRKFVAMWFTASARDFPYHPSQKDLESYILRLENVLYGRTNWFYVREILRRGWLAFLKSWIIVKSTSNE